MSFYFPGCERELQIAVFIYLLFLPENSSLWIRYQITVTTIKNFLAGVVNKWIQSFAVRAHNRENKRTGGREFDAPLPRADLMRRSLRVLIFLGRSSSFTGTRISWASNIATYVFSLFDSPRIWFYAHPAFHRQISVRRFRLSRHSKRKWMQLSQKCCRNRTRFTTTRCFLPECRSLLFLEEKLCRSGEACYDIKLQ